MNIRGKTFVVTGAGGGIGGELVLELLAQGARVIGVDVRDAGLKEIADRAQGQSPSFAWHLVDITNKEAVEKFMRKVATNHQSVDGLINCAGVIQPFVRVNDLDYEAVERVMNINFYGTLYMIKALLPYLLERPEGYIINVSSMGGFLPVPGQGVYGASKAAVKLLTEALYAELLDTNVHVSVVFPGATATDITKNSHVAIPNVQGSTEKMASSSLSPQKAAAIIVDGIKHNKPQIYTGKDSRLMNKLYRLNPVLATKFIAKQMKSLLS